MQKKYRIAVVGIGGVGGFLGGKLAAAYSGRQDTEVIFIARGDNAAAIRENGLKLITSSGEISVMPDSVTDSAGIAGEIDLLLCCTKTYDLENSLGALSAFITSNTLILPLFNGVDNTEKIQLLFPGAKVLQGCIYLVSKLTAPGVVQQRGEFHAVHFGGNEMLTTEMKQLADLLIKADINAMQENDIREKVWAKFSFISPIATYTSAHNISIGKILESNEHTTSLKKLMTELTTLAGALNIGLPKDCIEKNFQVMEKLPYEATSSMQLDFANGKHTELETLTGSVVRKAKEQDVQLDAYTDMYELLRGRQ